MNGKAQTWKSLIGLADRPADADLDADEGAAHHQVKHVIGDVIRERDSAYAAAMDWEDKYWAAEERGQQLGKENGVLAEQRDQALAENERLRTLCLVPQAELLPPLIYEQLAAEKKFELGVYDEPAEQAVAS